jgi:rhamnosyltransferase
MKILGSILSYNDAETIDHAVQALLGQCYPLGEVLIVDNGSTDGALCRVFPKEVAVIQNQVNLGPSGSFTAGLRYALAKGYDWIWILDADSLPQKDALERLVALYQSLDPRTQSQVGILACSAILAPSPKLFQGRCLTPWGMRAPKVVRGQSFLECDCTIWSGSLFKLQAVRAVGLPRCGKMEYWEDLSSDYGDIEYSYRLKQAGYKVLVHPSSIIQHSVGNTVYLRVLGSTILSTNHPPCRRYLIVRNMVYFWLNLNPKKRVIPTYSYLGTHLLITILKIVVMEKERLPKIRACLHGFWDGVFMKMDRQYG